MGSKMLIDAAHPEETRVVVVRGSRIEEFDYESTHRRQLKGNIYLAKVTRVEPSLQAAFVDYGGNRHGFLAFSEIHPDYYQIPVADRQALLREEEDDARRSEEEFDRSSAGRSGSRRKRGSGDGDDNGDENGADSVEDAGGDGGDDSGDDFGERASEASGANGTGSREEDSDNGSVEQVGVEDALEEVPERRRPPRRAYKIQEVIKRRQIMLVQVVKEERGNKGAALTSYLSLAGRYCVLMPNTARGGGISRKITDMSDRKRLKELVHEIEVPEGMGLIVRTAGAQRTKTEIKRDYDYLLRVWENVRDLTLTSTAPSLVYEEGSLIKRAIRDLYNKDVEDVVVEGEEGYREAKDFMKMLMPSHARNIKLHKDTRPLFSRHKVDSQLDGLFSPTVTLPSGGYLVMNQTEALVAIDINSGKATREHNIEDTALKTNMEAAEEIARQLRLRDLAGLIVIDFIDMDEKRNNRNVERRLKEALKNDRARIQVGRISHFGLLEMSRQRLRQGMLEGSTRPCPHCEGTGLVRSVSSSALSVLRGVEENLMSRKPENLTVYCHPEVANYIVNDKREHLLSLETGYGVSIFIVPRERVLPWESEIERGAERPGLTRRPAQELVSAVIEDEDETADEPGVTPPFEAPVKASVEASGRGPETSEARSEAGEDQPRRRRRRGRRGGRRSKDRADMTPAEQEAADRQAADQQAESQQPDVQQPGAPQPFEAQPFEQQVPEAAQAAGEAEPEAGTAEEPAAKPKRARRPRRPKVAASEVEAQDAVDQSADQPAEAAGAEPDADAPKPKRKRAPRKAAARKPKAPADAETQAGESVPEPAPVDAGSGNGAEREPPAPGGSEAPPPAGAHADREPEPSQPEERHPEQRQPESAQPESEQPRRWQPPEPTPKPAGPPRSGWWRR
jgi:ribonuclease E